MARKSYTHIVTTTNLYCTPNGRPILKPDIPPWNFKKNKITKIIATTSSRFSSFFLLNRYLCSDLNRYFFSYSTTKRQVIDHLPTYSAISNSVTKPISYSFTNTLPAVIFYRLVIENTSVYITSLYKRHHSMCPNRRCPDYFQMYWCSIFMVAYSFGNVFILFAPRRQEQSSFVQWRARGAPLVFQ